MDGVAGGVQAGQALEDGLEPARGHVVGTEAPAAEVAELEENEGQSPFDAEALAHELAGLVELRSPVERDGRVDEHGVDARDSGHHAGPQPPLGAPAQRRPGRGHQPQGMAIGHEGGGTAMTVCQLGFGHEAVGDAAVDLIGVVARLVRRHQRDHPSIGTQPLQLGADGCHVEYHRGSPDGLLGFPGQADRASDPGADQHEVGAGTRGFAGQPISEPYWRCSPLAMIDSSIVGSKNSSKPNSSSVSSSDFRFSSSGSRGSGSRFMSIHLVV